MVHLSRLQLDLRLKRLNKEKANSSEQKLIISKRSPAIDVAIRFEITCIPY